MDGTRWTARRAVAPVGQDATPRGPVEPHDGAPAPEPQRGTAVVDVRGGAALVPVLRGPRTVGLLVVREDGLHWQRTVDVEGLTRAALLAAAAVALPVGVASALRRPSARVDRLSMGPGGWVSFRGFPAPKGVRERRPWWARLLRAHRAT